MRIERPVPGLSIEQQPEDVVLRLLVCGEARGEQDDGGRLESIAMLGVLWSLRNRQMDSARSLWFGRPLKDLALQPWQYSCFNDADPNRAKLLDLWQTDPTSWERADTVCDLFQAGLTPLDPTGGATHYVVHRLWDQPRPPGGRAKWFDTVEIQAGRTKLTTILGNQVFARAA